MKAIFDLLSIAQDLLALADQAEAEAQDDGCRIVFAVARDCAFKIHAAAEREIRHHTAKRPTNEWKPAAGNDSTLRRTTEGV